MPERPVTEIDLRDLPPPLPFAQALEAARRLDRHGTLIVHTRFRPIQLIDCLPPAVWICESEEIALDHWETTLQRRTELPSGP